MTTFSVELLLEKTIRSIDYARVVNRVIEEKKDFKLGEKLYPSTRKHNYRNSTKRKCRRQLFFRWI